MQGVSIRRSLSSAQYSLDVQYIAMIIYRIIFIRVYKQAGKMNEGIVGSILPPVIERTHCIETISYTVHSTLYSIQISIDIIHT